MDKVWAYRLDSGLSGYGGSDTWEAFVLLERITYGEMVCICKRLHQRNLAALDLLERGSPEFLMMNLLEILAVEPIVVEPLVVPLKDDPLLLEPLVEPLVVEPLKDDPLLVEPLAELLKYDPLVEPLEDYDPLLVERLYDDPLLVEPLVANGLSYKQ